MSRRTSRCDVSTFGHAYSIRVCTVLDRLRPVPDDREHLLSRNDELRRSLHYLRRHHGEDDVRPRRALAAEATADEVVDDSHVLRRKIEDEGEPLPDAEDSLRRVVDGESLVALPDGDRGRRLHRVVVLHLRRVRRVERHVRGGERPIDVTALRVRLASCAHARRFVRSRELPSEIRERGGGGVASCHAGGGVLRALQRVCDDERDRLPRIEHLWPLEDLEDAVERDTLLRRARELRRVLVREDGEDPRAALRFARFDRDDVATGLGALDDDCVSHIRDGHLCGVLGLPRHLEPGVDAVPRPSGRTLAHVVTPSSRSARTTVRRASSILKLFCPRPTAPRTAASPAAR